jgi:murein DD-endopeptidase MepM/ murein hydrolase activator NlpD
VAYIFVHIGTDPTAWALENTDLDTVAAQLSQATAPVVLSVAGPLQGNLVVSPSAAATISVQRPSPGHGAFPSHITLPRNPVLYLSSLTGPTQDSPGYPLDPGTDLAAQEQAIIAAMSGRTVLSIQLPEMPGGVVLLNGAALDFAVLAQVHA